MIPYRIFKYERDRGILSVEYGSPGSGITTTVDATFAKSLADIHRLCVNACPIEMIDRLERFKSLDHAALEKLAGDYAISDSEVESFRQERKMVVLDTRSWRGNTRPRVVTNPTGPKVEIGQDRYLFIRYMTFVKAGDQELVHQHQFDHHTAVMRGKARFLVRSEAREIAAPAIVFIEASTDHEITALEDDTQVACIHNIQDLGRLA